MTATQPGLLTRNEFCESTCSTQFFGEFGRRRRWREFAVLATYAVLTLFLSSTAYAVPPTANAGPDQPNVNEQTNVTLNGSGSSDPELQPLSYSWVQIGVPAVSLTAADTASPSFTAPTRLVSQGPVVLTFELTVQDVELLTATDTVSITVIPVNDAPTANAGPDQPNAAEQTVVTLNGSGSSDNDGTIPGNGYAWTKIAGPAVTLNNANSSSPSFVAPTIAGGNPAISFTFSLRVTDNEGATSSADTVVVTVNPVDESPTANAQNVPTDEDTAVSITLTGSDPDGDSLTFELRSNPSNGSLGTLNTNTGAVTYTPNQNFNGSDSFAFRVNDGSSNSAQATVTINVSPVNDAPVVVSQIGNQTGTEDNPFSINVSANFDDVDDNLTFSATGLPATLAPIGAASGVINGTPTQADAEFNGGVYNVTVTASDGKAPPVNSSFTLTILPENDTPTATAQSVPTDEDTAVAITLAGSDPDGDSLTFELRSNPSNGSLGTLNTNTGAVTYTPNENFNGTDSFAFRVNDGSVNSAQATVTINVAPVNDAPVVVSQIGNQTGTEDNPFSINVSANFDDVDDDLTFSATGLPATLAPIGAASGVINGTPTQADAEFNGGVYNVTVTASDGKAPPVNSSFTLTILPENDVPVGDNQNISTDEDVPVVITLTGSDIDGDDVTFAIATGPANGTLGTLVGDTLAYTPNPNFNGADSFTFLLNDGLVNSAIATVSIDVISINDPPIVATLIGNQQAVEDSPFILDISTNFVDAENEDLIFTATGLPPSGNISFDENEGTFSGTPLLVDTDFDVGNTGIYNIVVTAIDGAGAMATDTFQLVVAALGRANLSLQVTAAPRPAMLLDEVRYDFIIRNAGPNSGEAIGLTGSFIGQNLTLSPTGSTGCTIQAPRNDSTDFSCTVGSLASGATFSLSISAASPGSGSITVIATAEGAADIPIDPDLADNSKQYAVGVAESFSNGAVDILGSSQVLSIAAGDLNNDGAIDLVVGTEVGQPARVYISDGMRAFNAGAISIPDNSAHQGIALADFDNNGFLDVVFANAGTPDTVYANDGGSSFTLMATLPGETLSNDVAVGQFNNDSNWDIALAVTGGNPIFVGDGSGGFTLSDTLGAADSRGVAAGPVDGNARHDIVFANVGDPSNLWTGNDSAQFTSKQTYDIGNASSVVIAELLGGSDAGALDVAFGRIPSDLGDIPANLVLSNDGSGTLSIARRLGAAPTQDVLVGDINRDGQNDLVFINDTGVHQIWNRSGSDFELWSEQIFDDGAIAGVLADLGTIDLDVGDPGGIDLAMGGMLAPGAGVFLNDGFGNLGKGDAVAPELALLGDNPFNVPSGTVFVDPGASALDNIDGDISNRVVTTGSVNSAVVGSYILTYNVSDFAGNPAEPVTREVIINVAAGGGGGGGGTIAPLTLLLTTALFIAVMYRRHRSIVSTNKKKTF